MSTIFPQVATDEFIRAAFESVPTGLVAVDGAGVIVALNREVERQFGYTRDELLGQPVELLVPIDLAAGHAKLRALYAAIPTTRRMGAGRELHGRRKDGRLFPVEIGLSPISTRDGHFVLATIADIRERLHRDHRRHQPHKLEVLGSLASGVAHDLNESLRNIVGHAELACAAVSDRPSAVADLDALVDTARQCRELVNRILVCTHTTEPPRAETDFVASAQATIQLLRSSLPSSIEVREGLDPNTPPVMADVDELRQIVMNLVTNAAHAMQSRGGVVEIRLGPFSVDRLFLADHPGLHEGPHIHLSVADTGVGIHPDDIGHIYEPFYTTKPRGEGIGLGLAVVDRIVQSLGGTIEVRSRVGEGTRFDVYLPSASLRTGQVQEALSSRLERRHILLVDDEGSLVRLGQRLLESAGFEVTAHSSSLYALESFRMNPGHFALLITDSAMPAMSGLELVDRILAIRPGLPVLMVQGEGEAVSTEALRGRGITRVLPKPYDPTALAAMVNELVGASS